MASIAVLAALLTLTWFLFALLILTLTLTFLYFKETYKLTGVQVMSLAELTPTPFTDLLSALLGFFLTTLLSVLALALTVPLTLCLTLRHLEKEHQWAFNIAATAQRPLLHTTTNLPIIATNRDSNNPTQVYFEHNNSPTAGPQRAATPFPSHIQTLEERFTAGVIEMPVPRHPILSFPSQQESDDSSLEFLDKGGFCYLFTSPFPNATRHPFLIPGPLDSSNSDAIVLHLFPGPLELPQASEATTRSYHVAPAQVFPSSSPMNTLSSPNPDSPLAASTDSPSMPLLASDISDDGSLDHAPNLWLLANFTAMTSSSDPPMMSLGIGGPSPLTPPPQFKMSTPWNACYLTSLEHTLPLLLNLLWAFPSMEILPLDYDEYRQLQPMCSKSLSL
ncbi:uncharacterized protein FIBRA_08766 [Fibroporia radiculosa]|uniref:Uncharacterized protein n=1 Tax=Fibroporia radiculosa TaxID=599839 RepID=J4ICJ0_9APHY|nr:uncharacterized protein FIBRA_08766 [Fibroporia radiculosa]CCM06496.1 predicted protein [Fibroporia radiculosa]